MNIQPRRLISGIGHSHCIVFWTVAVIVTLGITGAVRAEVNWKNLLAESTSADQDQTYYVIYLALPGCPYCAKLEREVFTNSQFQALGDKGLFLKFFDDVDNAAQREQMAKHFQISSYPALLVLKKDGDKRKQTGVSVGYKNAADTLAFLKFQLGLADKYSPDDPEAGSTNLLAAGANHCPRGDLECLLKSPDTVVKKASDKDVEEVIKSLNEFLADLDPQALQKPDNDALEKLILAAGHKAERKTSGEGFTYFTVQEPETDLDFFYSISLSPNHRRVWLSMPLSGKLDLSKVPAELLAQLLAYNHTHGPLHFNLQNGSLMLSLALDNVDLTAERLQAAIDEMKSTTRATLAVWSKLSAYKQSP